jgi:hypothetical protein
MTVPCLQDSVPCRQGTVPVYRDSGLSTRPPHVNTALHVNMTLPVNRALHVNMTLVLVHMDLSMSTCSYHVAICLVDRSLCLLHRHTCVFTRLALVNRCVHVNITLVVNRAAAEGTLLHGLRHPGEGHMDCDVWCPSRIDHYGTEQRIFPARSGGRVGRVYERQPTQLV